MSKTDNYIWSEITRLEREKDAVSEQLLKWKEMSIVTIVRLKRERESLQKRLDELYLQLSI
jgi:hypothetical protein